MIERQRPPNQQRSPPLLEVTSLGSGSSGNALLVQTAGTNILVDCGVSVRRMARDLSTRGVSLSDVTALLISHEHSDHIRELSSFVAAGTRILSTKGTAVAARIPSGCWIEVRPHQALSVGACEVIAVPVSHDAREPCGFVVRTPGGTVTVLTDLGAASPVVADAISEACLVVLEANHDRDMLRRGPYPVHLQRRILSDFGHLSNDDCARLLSEAIHASNAGVLPTIWLAHLSETNNRPSLATRAVNRHLAKSGLLLDVQALPRREASATWRATGAKPGVAQLALEL